MRYHPISVFLLFLVLHAGSIPATAQLFENLEKFVDRVNVGDPEVTHGREGPKGVALVDFDGDGKPDIATSNLDGTISVAWGKGGLDFEQAVHLRTGSLTL
ncbi:MAG: VCBS repeat-containing protein, partial [Verrucomicrobiota bacterium]